MFDSTILTVIVGLISDRFKLTSVQTLSISKILDWAVQNSMTEDVCWDWSYYLSYFYWSWVLLIPLTLSSLYWIIPWYQNRNKMTVTIYCEDTLKIINKYVNYYPQNLQTDSLSLGSYHSFFGIPLYIPLNWSKMKVNDILCEIRAQFERREDMVEMKNPRTGDMEMKTKVSHIPYATLCLSRTIAFKDLVDQIKSLNLHQQKIRDASMIECSGSQIKSITQNEIKWLNFTFYKSSRSKHNIDAIINSYFCVSRDRMLQSVRTALADNRNWNALLHGPPGTGKSCFATLLAKVLERNIVSVDLRLMNRSQLLTTLFAEDYKRKIFVLEEFDNTVREFVRRERETKLMEIDGKLIRPPPDPNVLHLTDLLEIFQGPIPRPKMIIIATTNDLEYIQGTRSDSDFEGLPALIRPGRLTPWYIGYVNNEILAQIIRFYFPTVEHIDFNLPSFHQVSTCAIVEYAKSSLGDYELFKKWLIQHVEK